MVITVWPIHWIDKTFTSRTRTEELLRPELENSLTPGDFEKALDFLPATQRHWKVGRVATFSNSLSRLTT
jgi:hypothetical protein